MHELLLYGQVPRARHEQVLKVLAGVAAMQPRRALKRHIVYKPNREPEEPGSNLRRGGAQTVAQKNVKQSGQKDLYFQQLVQQLSEGDFTTAGADSKWTYEFHDVPEAGDRGGVLVRMTYGTDILDGEPHAYMVAGENQFVSEYYIEGHCFVLDNIVIFLHRILHEPGVRNLQTAPKETLPSFTDLQPLDPSGAYILEAKIRVQDLHNEAVSQAGVDELNRFRKQMKGCVELAAPERLDMDTRVKYKPKGVHPPTQKPVQARAG